DEASVPSITSAVSEAKSPPSRLRFLAKSLWYPPSTQMLVSFIRFPLFHACPGRLERLNDYCGGEAKACRDHEQPVASAQSLEAIERVGKQNAPAGAEWMPDRH